MPAAAVIPAPIAYIKVVAVKKRVAEGWWVCCGPHCEHCGGPTFGWDTRSSDYFEKIRVFKAGLCSDSTAWNNGIGRMVLFCWFLGPS